MLNLTPHAINVMTNGEMVVYEPSGIVARVEMEEFEIGDFNGVPLIRRVMKGVIGLPDDDTPCIVSSMVLDAIDKTKKNVFAPDTGSSAIRNDKGHIVAVTRFVTI